MSARQGRVRRPGRALLALCAAGLSSWWPAARADRLDDDLDAVWESAWDQHGTATRLTRWERPVRWRLAGTDSTRHHKTVSQAMAAVAQGSGRDIAEAPAGAAEANLTFEVVAEERLADSIGCETQITQSVWAIVEARVAMRESQVWECAYHEAMHAMGVPGHPAGKTVLSYFPWRSDKLLDLDRLLLATWYDPALSRGDTVFDVLRVGGQRAIRQPEIGIAPEAAELRRRDHFARRVAEMERFARGDGDVPMIIRRSGRASPGHIEDSRNLMAYFLGLVFAAGHSLTKDEARAAAWFEKAARRKYFPAQLELARLLARGAGAAPDVVEAHRWFSSAARAGSFAAERERAQLEKRMDEAQIEKARALGPY